MGTVPVISRRSRARATARVYNSAMFPIFYRYFIFHAMLISGFMQCPFQVSCFILHVMRDCPRFIDFDMVTRVVRREERREDIKSRARGAIAPRCARQGSFTSSTGRRCSDSSGGGGRIGINRRACWQQCRQVLPKYGADYLLRTDGTNRTNRTNCLFGRIGRIGPMI